MTRYVVSLAVAVLVCALAFPVILDLSAYLAAGWGSALEVVVRAFTSQSEAPKSESRVSPPASARGCDVDSLLSSLEHRDPVAEATASVARENFVLLGVHASEVPGVEGDPACWAREVGVVWIPDTSEPRCAEHERLQGVARSFAERYNRLVVEAYLRGTRSECGT